MVATAFAGCIEDKKETKASFGANEIRLYTQPLSYEVVRDGKPVVLKTQIGLKLDGVCCSNATIVSTSKKKLSGTVATPVYKKSSVDLSGSETYADFGDFAIRLVAREDGVAYRFELKKAARIDCEKANFTVPTAARCVFNRTRVIGAEETTPEFANAGDLSKLKMENKGKYIYLPFTYMVDGKSVLVTESDIHDYPVWYFGSVEDVAGGVKLNSFFAGYPKTTERVGGWGNVKNLKEGGRWVRVTSHEDYLVNAKGARALPWRVFVLADKPEKLCENDIVFALAKPADPKADFSWVKPGKVAWEWWNGFNNQATKKKPIEGCNTETYKKFIDFAAKTGVEYVIMDEGWSASLNIWKFSDKVDVPYLIDYANKKGVGIILWMAWAQVYGVEEKVASHFAKLGAKGFKVDFMDRGDAEIANFLENFAKACAKHKMLIDYHGATRPVGLHREYPNVLNYEGIHGLEMMKFTKSDKDMTFNDVACVFTRMCAGPMDYTPGAMNNYKIGEYKGDYGNPGSVGTRAHQMALMAIYEAPLQMLCDSVINYEKNMECFSFMAKMPVVWDKVVGLPGCPEKMAAVARKAKNGSWYAAAITNKDAREYELPTCYLGEGTWKAEIFRDADSSDNEPMKYVHETKTVKAGDKLKLRMASGGGFVVHFTK